MAGDFNSAVIDASFILTFLLPDEDIPEVNKTIWLYRRKALDLISCYLFPFEVFNCLRTAIFRKRISGRLASDLGNTFLKLDIKCEVINFEEALKIAEKANLSFYDASYLWLARSKNLPLLTLDDRLRRLGS